MKAKKLLSLLLVISMPAAVLPAAASGRSGQVQFEDVPHHAWYSAAVRYVCAKGLMQGTGAETFSPDMKTTRGMIVTILYRMEDTRLRKTADFPDVQQGKYYADAIDWADDAGIVEGYDSGFAVGPDDLITREEMAVIFYRYINYKGYSRGSQGDISAFGDCSSAASYAIEGLNWAAGNGLLQGVGNNLLAPKGQTTRAEVAALIMRFCESYLSTHTNQP